MMFYMAKTDAGSYDLRAYGTTRDEAERALMAGIEIYMARLGIPGWAPTRDRLIADMSVEEFRPGGVYMDGIEIGLVNA